MTNELRAAAEDVLSHTFYDSSGIGMKAQAVAEAYRDEHPVDEHEIATVEWLLTFHGSSRREPYTNLVDIEFPEPRSEFFIELIFTFDSKGDYQVMLEEWVIYDGPVQTRREVRNMLAVFGLKERQ